MTAVTQEFFETLMRTQALPADDMQVYQRGLLERLLRHARAQVPYYRDGGRLDAVFARDGSINWERWDEIPILTRLEAQQNAEALYAEFVPPECGEVMTGYTAGSTGTPLAFRVNMLLANAGSAVLERGMVWAGLPAQMSLAWFRNDKQGGAAYPHGATYESTLRGARRLMHHLAVQTPLDDQGRWLARIRPDVVMGYPGALALLGRELPPALDDHRFRLAISVGEVLTDDNRAEISECFRCPVMDLYSGSDFGPVAVEDVHSRRLLICEEIAQVEFQEPGGFVPSDSELAEVIVTPFYNYAMPLIRYAPGDFAVVEAVPERDGRTLRRLERVGGARPQLLHSAERAALVADLSEQGDVRLARTTSRSSSRRLRNTASRFASRLTIRSQSGIAKN